MQLYGGRKAFHILIDALRPMLRLAKKKAHALGYSDTTDFVVADAENLPIRTDSCDLVSCIDTLHHIEPANKNSAFCELARVAMHDGYVLVEIKNRLFPHYMLGLSRRNPAGVSTGSDYFGVRSLFMGAGFTEVFSVGALPWGLAIKIISPSILMGFRKDRSINCL